MTRTLPPGCLELPTALLKAVRAEAVAAFPRECCGLLVGTHAACGAEGEVWRVRRVVRAANVAERADRFEIDPQTLIDTHRACRGTEEAVIGVYHSHPTGRAEPSATDAARADDPTLAWLIVAVTERPEDGAAAWRIREKRTEALALRVEGD